MCQIWLPTSISVLLFSKKAWIILCKTNLDLIWMARSGFGQTRLHIWSGSKLTCRNHRAWFLATVRSSTDVPDRTVQNQPGSNLVLADCVRFWPNGSNPEASWCARIIWPTSGQCFQANPHWMQIGSGMFTGKVSWFSVRIHSLQPLTWSCTWFFKYLWHVFKGDGPHILLLLKPWCLLFSLKTGVVQFVFTLSLMMMINVQSYRSGLVCYIFCLV